MKKKALFLALVGILTASLLFISREFPAQAYTEDNLVTKEEPSDEIKQLYKELKLKISQLEKEISLPPRLEGAQEEIKEISLELEDIQPKGEPETAQSRNKVKLNPDSRALVNKKRELQTELHIANIPLEAAKNELAASLKKKEKLESEYFLVPIEIPILAEIISELKEPIITIVGELELKRCDDIDITLVLSRSIAASAFCEVYLNDTFVNRERWKIGPKGKFTTTIAATHKAEPQIGPNSLTIVLNTSYQEDDVLTKSPSFEKNPLTIFNTSRIAARNLVSGSFKIRQIEEKKTLVEDTPQPPAPIKVDLAEEKKQEER